MYEVGPAGEAGLRLVFLEAPQPTLTRFLLSLQQAARSQFSECLADTVVGYTTLTLLFHPLQWERDRAGAWLAEQAEKRPLADLEEALAAESVVTLPFSTTPA